MYAPLLGEAWRALPESIRRLHEQGTVRIAAGIFRVRRGSNLLATVIGRLGGMPPAGESAAVNLVVSPEPGGEEWRRKFGDASLVSTQRRDGGAIVERFGPIEVRFRLAAGNGSLRYLFDGGSLRFLGLRIPLPLTASAHEIGRDDGGIDVSVDVAMKGIGRIVAYDGTLTRIEIER